MGIGNGNIKLEEPIDWLTIKNLSERQGLSAIVLDGVDKLPEDLRPKKELALIWIGEVIQGYEQRYQSYKRAIADLANFYAKHSIKMMVLKGYACSLDWPKPEHRPCGDIDIWLFGDHKRGDDIIQNKKAIRVDSSEHHHTVFCWCDFLVENHYDFLNIHQHRSSVAMEKIFKELGKDDSYSQNILGEKIYLPSPNLHALFLLKHSMVHFAAESINARQLLDWAFFVKAHGSEVDWLWLESIIEQYGMKPLYDCYNAICIDDLGFSPTLFSTVQFNPFIKEHVLKEIISPEFSTDLPSCFIKRVLYKYRRWKASEWKHKLCYNEGMWESFWSGVWNHITKPSTI